MTPDYLPADELRRLFPGISTDVLRRSAIDAPGNRPRPKLQEQQAPDSGKACHGASQAKVDEASADHYRITIAFRVSDQRERDGDGGESTILDCIVRARKRLLSLPDKVLLAIYERTQKSGGSIDPD